MLKEGTDVTLITSGFLTSETLKAADMLEADRISAKVVNIFTWKPIDKELIIQSAEQTGAIVTVENHSTLNGLGSAVAEVLGREYTGTHGENRQSGQVRAGRPGRLPAKRIRDDCSAILLIKQNEP